MKKITFSLFFLVGFAITSGAQTYFSDDFSDGDISDWTLVDSDGDGNDWSIVNYDDGVQNEHLSSSSWINPNPVTPDNWAITPAIDLSSASGTINLEWKVYGQDQDFADENYTVYVATAATTADLLASGTTFNEIVGTSAAYMQRTLDVSSFAGQTIYVGFRHHNVSDEFRINIDDVVVRTPLNLEAIVESVFANRYSLTNTDNQLSLEVTNGGSDTITSLDVNWNDGTDHIETIAATINPNATVTVNHPVAISSTNVEQKDIVVTITAVNNTADGDPSNNTGNTTINFLSQSGASAILIEQGTGTWCGWCPRGKVGVEYMLSTYPNTVIPVEVHGSAQGAPDPMQVDDYISGFAGYVSGFPGAALNRILGNVDPGQTSLEPAYNALINNVVPVDVTSQATISGNDLTITANAQFYSNFSNATYRLAVIITEDNVTGTTSDYNQANFYSGGSNGAMGGYENLPNPIPASQVVYNHVGIALLGGFNGEANSVPTTIADGDSVTYEFNYTIPSTSDQNNLNIITLVIDETNGTIVNGATQTVAEALSIDDNVFNDNNIKVYPNPTTDNLTIEFGKVQGNYSLKLTDMLGRTVLDRKNVDVFNNQNIELSLTGIRAGQYILTLNNDGNSFTTKIIKQ